MIHADSIYETTILNQSRGTTVEFYISATDSDGNVKQSDTFSITVGELEIPGFPFESIILGFAMGIVLLLYLMKRRAVSLTPQTLSNIQ